ncbi:MAG: flagellar hook assembly protein FlgD [Spirochaetaceae bacterium]
MDLQNTMNAQEMARLEAQVDAFNKSIGSERQVQQDLGRDQFLKLLMAQLQNQDPTSPMEDKQFIAQMAEFSALEQMTNLSTEFTRVAGLVSSGQAVSLLGREVAVADGESVIEGVVEAVQSGDNPQVQVNGTFYDYGAVQTIKGATE